MPVKMCFVGYVHMYMVLLLYRNGCIGIGVWEWKYRDGWMGMYGNGCTWYGEGCIGIGIWEWKYRYSWMGMDIHGMGMFTGTTRRWWCRLRED